MPHRPYQDLTIAELHERQADISERRFDSPQEIQTAFFGDAPCEVAGHDRHAAWVRQFAESHAGNVHRRRFPRHLFCANLESNCGALTALTILYYLALAIYYWRKYRDGIGAPVGSAE